MTNDNAATKFLVQDLDLYYGKFQALKKINLDIKEKEITALIGPSGCGKSTFLKTLNRMNDSALDPISTMKIEDLALELKKDYTIVIVTHNMQQAARISDKTAFFLLGELIEFNETKQLFANPSNPKTEEYITGRFG